MTYGLGSSVLTTETGNILEIPHGSPYETRNNKPTYKSLSIVYVFAILFILDNYAQILMVTSTYLTS